MSQITDNPVTPPTNGGGRGERPGRRRRAKSALIANGEPMIWLTGGALVMCTIMIIGLLLLVLARGLSTFWPLPVEYFETYKVEYDENGGPTAVVIRPFMGEVTRSEEYELSKSMYKGLPPWYRDKLRAKMTGNAPLPDGLFLSRESEAKLRTEWEKQQGLDVLASRGYFDGDEDLTLNEQERQTVYNMLDRWNPLGAWDIARLEQQLTQLNSEQKSAMQRAADAEVAKLYTEIKPLYTRTDTYERFPFNVDISKWNALPKETRQTLKVSGYIATPKQVVDESIDDEHSITAFRRLVRTGNYRLTQTHFEWISDFELFDPATDLPEGIRGARRMDINASTFDEDAVDVPTPNEGESTGKALSKTPQWSLTVERVEWGRFYGFPKAFAYLDPVPLQQPCGQTLRDALSQLADTEQLDAIKQAGQRVSTVAAQFKRLKVLEAEASLDRAMGRTSAREALELATAAYVEADARNRDAARTLAIDAANHVLELSELSQEKVDALSASFERVLEAGGDVKMNEAVAQLLDAKQQAVDQAKTDTDTAMVKLADALKQLAEADESSAAALKQQVADSVNALIASANNLSDRPVPYTLSRQERLEIAKQKIADFQPKHGGKAQVAARVPLPYSDAELFTLLPVAQLEEAESLVGIAEVLDQQQAAWDLFREHHADVRDALAEKKHIKEYDVGRVSKEKEKARLAVRRAELELNDTEESHGEDSPQYLEAREALILATAAKELVDVRTETEFLQINERIAAIDRSNAQYNMLLQTTGEKDFDAVAALTPLAEIVQMYPANQLSLGGKLSVYLARWHEFLFDDPREANTEGGVKPAIIGTVLMTLIMALVVVPFGVLAALYLREYAKSGFVVSIVRIAVNNLAGVPSIVFGVFGRGFFCYTIGGFIDGGADHIDYQVPKATWFMRIGILAAFATGGALLTFLGMTKPGQPQTTYHKFMQLFAGIVWFVSAGIFFLVVLSTPFFDGFYEAKFPNPTFGKGALIWASATLALMTLPVVIVATEEALSAVPNSMREGSYACGASKWQTIKRIVLPRAMPGIMTGMILAMARGAGEVAPLMIVGAVKLAPKLPFHVSPYISEGFGADEQFGVNRSFMHLGFHIYDVGFQSPNSEAAKPMVYTTTLLLIAIVALLNLTAIWLRKRLRRRFVSSQF